LQPQESALELYGFQSHKWGNHTEVIVSALMLTFLAITVLCLVMGHYVAHKWRPSWLPEAGVVLLIGVVAGALLTASSGDISGSLLSFSPTLFFLIFLPPIIFNSAYHMRRQFFFSNFSWIMLFATLGTLVSAILVASLVFVFQHMGGGGDRIQLEFSECLTFGALISATDPVSTLAVFAELRVDPTLFYIVFGESLLNDAVGLVLFTTFSKFVGFAHGPWTLWIAVLDFFVIMVGSALIGYVWGVVSAMIIKLADLGKDPICEVCTYVLLSYMPFLLSEMLGMSGIVTILFSGMTMRRYAHNNLSSDSSRTMVDALFRTAATLAETAVFLNLGMTVFGYRDPEAYRVGLIVAAVAACLVGRAFSVFGLCHLRKQMLHLTASCCGERFATPALEGGVVPQRMLSNRMQLMLWFAGLRGAVAFACATLFPDKFGHRKEVIVTTMVIVLTTVFLMGGLTSPMLKYLHIDLNVDIDRYQPPEIKSKVARALLWFDTNYIVPKVSQPEALNEMPRPMDAVRSSVGPNRPALTHESAGNLRINDECAISASSNGLGGSSYVSPLSPASHKALGPVEVELAEASPPQGGAGLAAGSALGGAGAGAAAEGNAIEGAEGGLAASSDAQVHRQRQS